MSDATSTSNVLAFRKNGHRRPRTEEPSPTDVHELELPPPEKISPAELLTALAREPAPDFQDALVVMRLQEKCPCGCGEETEVYKVFTAGAMHAERINWICDKMKLRSLGIDIGEDDE